jgi:hypothetical protein
MEHVQQITVQGTENYNKHTSRGRRSQDAQGKDGMINDAKTGNTAYAIKCMRRTPYNSWF